ncbi:MAG: lysine--tRNA ligase [Candidatus Brocadiae bacterium]|nr:lysine--tRNA ligase [Candidatus Brocadiia bacterium]
MPFHQDLLEKRQQLLDLGVNPYPYSFAISHTLTELRDRSQELMEKEVSVAGRITALRRQGQKVFFADIEDFDNRMQVYLKQQDFSEQIWQTILLLDIGDWVGIKGPLFATKTGELTIWTKEFSLLAKSVIRVPISKEKGDKKYYQLSDSETLYRQRYLHWITDKKAREVMLVRAKILSSIRRFMEGRGFLEVTTPTLELSYGGASARPFETTVHALSQEKAYMRISPELSLKRFIVGGFPKVYTICQNFRNEGIDRSHNPEFTMMEWYEAFTDYNYQMDQFEQLVSMLAKEITGSYKVVYQDTEIDFTPPWKRMTILDAIKEIGKVDVNALSDEELKKKVHEIDPKYQIIEPFSRGHIVDFLFSNLCEEHMIQPTFILDHPLAISPLTKKKRGNPDLVERFEPFVMRMEIGNAYSELTDPVEQYERLRQQREFDADNLKKEGTVHHPVDLDFVRAIGMGMPPTGGVGLGIDRLVMLLTNQHSIRDVIAFPLLRREE